MPTSINSPKNRVVPHDFPDRRREDAWTIDRRVSIGNILTLVALAVGLFAGWSALGTQVTLNSQRIDQTQTLLESYKKDILDRMAADANREEKQIAEVKQLIKDLDKKIERTP